MSNAKSPLIEIAAQCIHYGKGGYRARSGRTFDWILDLRPMLLSGYGAQIITEQFLPKLPRGHQIAGVGVSGTILVSALVIASQLSSRRCNGLVIREQAKSYGRQRQIEGEPTKEPVVLVDDLVNSGTTLFEAVGVLQANGLRVTKIMVVVDFEREVVKEWLRDEGISLIALSTLQHVRAAASKLPKNLRR